MQCACKSRSRPPRTDVTMSRFNIARKHLEAQPDISAIDARILPIRLCRGSTDRHECRRARKRAAATDCESGSS